MFDWLTEGGAATCHPDDRASFLQTFSRKSLLAAYARGEKMCVHEGRQTGDDGVYRHVCTEAVFDKGENGDVLILCLVREYPAPAQAEERKGEAP